MGFSRLGHPDPRLELFRSGVKQSVQSWPIRPIRYLSWDNWRAVRGGFLCWCALVVLLGPMESGLDEGGALRLPISQCFPLYDECFKCGYYATENWHILSLDMVCWAWRGICINVQVVRALGRPIYALKNIPVRRFPSLGEPPNPSALACVQKARLSDREARQGSSVSTAWIDIS